MKLTITFSFVMSLGLSLLTGCGALSNATTLEIQMYGVANAPTGATGTKDPQFQTYEVTSITLDGADGPTNLLSVATPFKIVDRPQILVSQNADKFVGKVYTGLTVVFTPTVVGGTSSASTLKFDLTPPTLTLKQEMSFEKSKTKTFAIKAAWANTVGDNVMSEPTLTIVPD
ncbi:MAG: hypothetical protein H7249_06895 [Chitinophagaceae bacterium]|nr:hypothetical protein [Oligoflexus sp.]